MSPAKTRNIGHSVFQRLLNHAKTQGEEFNLLLFRYGVERLLYRLSISPYADRFILKGASLFLVWKGQSYRVTKDADFLCFGPSDTEHTTAVFKGLCEICSDNEDGIIFMADTVRAVPIREEPRYPTGVHWPLQRNFGKMRRSRFNGSHSYASPNRKGYPETLIPSLAPWHILDARLGSSSE